MKKSILSSTILAAFAAFTGYAGGVISVNIAKTGGSGSVTGSASYGLAPAIGNTWYNVTEDNANGFTISVSTETRDGVANNLDTAVELAFSTTGSFSRYNQAGITAEEPYMDAYIDDSAGIITIDVDHIPYSAYQLIVYLGADWRTSSWPEGTDFNPISVNGTYYGYSSSLNKTVVCGEHDYWGSFGSGAAKEGVNTLRVPTQLGEKLTFSIPKRAHRGSLLAFQIVEAKVDTVDAISLNLGSSYGAMSEQGGLDNGVTGKEILASSWNDIGELQGESVPLKMWNGATLTTDMVSGLAASWSIKGVYGKDSVPLVFRRGWCDTRGAGKWTVEITGIPFKEYDVYVYMNWDGNGSWSSVKINEEDWSYDASLGAAVRGTGQWGSSSWPEKTKGPAMLGENVICVPSISGSTLSLGGGDNALACGIQLVKRTGYEEIVATDDIATKNINSQVGAAGRVYVTIPAGKKLVLSKSGLLCEKLFVCCEGDCIIDTDYDPADPEYVERFNATMAKIDTSCVPGMVFHGWKPTAGVISVNFNSGKGAMAGLGGFEGAFAGEEIPAASWNDMTGASGEENLKVWKGGELALVPADDSTVKLTWNAGGVYYYTSGVEDNFLKGYLEDNATPEITVSGIPFEKYDLIVYLAADWGGVSYKHWEGADFNPIDVNGVKYTWSAVDGKAIQGSGYWGEFAHSVAEYGVNALRITGLTASELTFNAGQRNRRGGIAAIQIVEPAKKRRYSAGLIITIR